LHTVARRPIFPDASADSDAEGRACTVKTAEESASMQGMTCRTASLMNILEEGVLR